MSTNIDKDRDVVKSVEETIQQVKGVTPQQVQYRLADDIPFCMECDKPFDTHSKAQQKKCLKHAKDRHASAGNMMYLGHGFRMYSARIVCMYKGCTTQHSVPKSFVERCQNHYWKTDENGERIHHINYEGGKYVCEEHSEEEFDSDEACVDQTELVVCKL